MPSIVEKLIQNAIAAGEFDDLEGKGKPLDLTEYFAAPEDVRAAYAILRSNDILPGEVEMLNEVAELRRRLAQATDDDQRAAIRRVLNEKQLALDLTIERLKRKA